MLQPTLSIVCCSGLFFLANMLYSFEVSGGGQGKAVHMILDMK